VNHTDLTTLILSAHGAIFLAGATAYYKYGDRTDVLQKPLNSCNSTLAQLRARISTKLADQLRSVYRDPVVPSVIVTPTGQTYSEPVVNPVGSEAFFESVQRFVEDEVEVMVDYQELRHARSCWYAWARRLSWLILAVLVWEVAASALVLADKLEFARLGDGLLHLTFVPSGALIVICLAALVVLQRQHDKIAEKWAQYNDL